jgi:hypothetical protein
MDRVDTLVTTEDDKRREREHVNGYKEWIFKAPKRRPKTKNNDNPTASKISVRLPYISGLSEKLTTIFRNHNVGTYHKPINTIRSFLVHPKDKIADAKKCGVVYQVNCANCDATYVGEAIRSLNTRYNDHCKTTGATTAVGDHLKQHKHKIKLDDVQVLAREDNFWKRKIREAIEIKTECPTLNRDAGYDLPAIYDDLLSHDRPHGWSCDQ